MKPHIIQRLILKLYAVRIKSLTAEQTHIRKKDILKISVNYRPSVYVPLNDMNLVAEPPNSQKAAGIIKNLG